MNLVHGNENNFNELILEGTVVVDFFATWCGPCKMLGPVLEEVASEKNIKIVKIDVDESSNLARNYGIMSVPTLLIFKNNKLIDQKTGFLPKEKLIEWIESK